VGLRSWGRTGVPELDGIGTDCPPVRLPLRGNIPTTRRLRALLDTAPVQRLRGVRQLGLAQLVYPGAVHTRFEHSLGTYEMARRMLVQLAERRPLLGEEDVLCFLAAALLHDVGHYPFSHTLEEIPADREGRFGIPRHDGRARQVILGDGRLAAALRDLWGVDPERVCRVIDEGGGDAPEADLRLREMLCGPLNPDRLDYLERDSSHVGVPYGRVIDGDRLLAALDFTPDGRRLGVTSKGISAVETLIFASYLMYREVYWHHTVRAAQAMFKRAATDAFLAGELRPEDLVDLDDEQAVAALRACRNPATGELVRRLTGPGRGLYRRVFSAGLERVPEGFLQAAAEADYWTAQVLCGEVARRVGAEPHHLLLDVSGRGKELFFEVTVVDRPGLPTTADPDVSLIAPSLHFNFDRQAKRVLLLAPAEWVPAFRRYLGLREEGRG
jgi:HD superfamily phosphohydrolase